LITSQEQGITKQKWKDIHKTRSFREISNDEKLELKYALLHIKKFLKNRNGLFLEAGCGVSRILPSISKKEIKCVGIDLSGEAIKKTILISKLKSTKIKMVQGDILNLPFKDNNFFFIYSGGVIEHLNTQKALEELYRCLKPGGMLSATVPCFSLSYPYLMLRGNIPDLPIIRQFLEFIHIDLLKGKYLKFGYEKSFTPKRIKKLFTKTGFIDIEIGLFETHYPLKLFDSIPKLKSFLSNLAENRFFWPMIYVNGKRKKK